MTSATLHLFLATVMTVSVGISCRSPTHDPVELPETTVAPPEAPPETRRADPNPEAVRHALETTLQIPARVLAQEVLPRTHKPFADIALLRVPDQDYCRVYTSPKQPARCDYKPREGGVPREVCGRLALAVVEFENPAPPAVVDFRFLATGGAPTGDSPSSEDPQKPRGENLGAPSGLGELSVESVVAEDVDGDGETELVVTVAYTSFQDEQMYEDTIDMEDAYWRASEQRQLLIVRDDLSLQHEQVIENTYVVSEGRTNAEQHLFTHHELVRPGGDRAPGLLVEWCEVDVVVTEGDSTDCELKKLCEAPTHRSWYPYDPKTDAYSWKKSEQLRPIIDDAELDEVPVCLD